MRVEHHRLTAGTRPTGFDVEPNPSVVFYCRFQERVKIVFEKLVLGDEDVR